MNNTHVRKLVWECIATGKRSVIRPKKTWRDHHPWRGTRLEGLNPVVVAAAAFSSDFNVTFVFCIRSDVIQRFCILFLTRRSQGEERLTDMTISNFGLE